MSPGDVSTGANVSLDIGLVHESQEDAVTNFFLSPVTLRDMDDRRNSVSHLEKAEGGREEPERAVVVGSVTSIQEE